MYDSNIFHSIATLYISYECVLRIKDHIVQNISIEIWEYRQIVYLLLNYCLIQ
jgi:hypothetical protein